MKALKNILLTLLLSIPFIGKAQVDNTPQINYIPQLYLSSTLDSKEPANTYRFFRKEKLIGTGLSLGAGFLDGVEFGYLVDNRKSFERKYGVAPRSWLGSQSYLQVYTDWDASKGYKSNLHKWYGANDGIHAIDRLQKVMYISGGFYLGKGASKYNNKWYQDAADLLLVQFISATGKNLGYRWIRN